MPSRARTVWRLSTDGQYVRQIGYTLSRSGKRVQAKFRLGANRKEAKRRDLLIRQLWDQVEATAQAQPINWPAELLAAAKAAAATGRAVITLERSDGEDSGTYALRVADLRATMKDAHVEPADQHANRMGRHLWQSGADMLRWINRVQTGKFEVPARYSTVMGRENEVAGPSLHEALRSYIVWLESEYADPDREVTAWGRTQIRQVGTLLDHHRDCPLAQLDYSAVEEMIRYWRKRPLSRVKGSGKPVAKKSAQNYIKTLKGFLKWLHRAEKYEWRRPADLEDIRTRVELVEGDRAPQLVADDLFTLDELAILYKYATPLERMFLLLSLNCHFGQAEISTLRMDEIFLESPHSKKQQEVLGYVGGPQDSFIRRSRRKTSVYGEWLLFPHTVQALEWALARRKRHARVSDEGRLILNDKGRPYDEPTASGNANQQIANRFADLIRRVQQDGRPEFAKRPFKMIRKTAATMIRELADGEIQGLFTSHGQPVATDDLADVYAVRPFGKLFVAIRKLQDRLEPVFATVGSSPFEARPKGSTPLSKREDLIKLANSGLSVAEIASATALSRSSVYRHLKNSN